MQMAVQPNYGNQGNFANKESELRTGLSCNVSPSGQVSSQIQLPGGVSPDGRQATNMQGSSL